MKNKKILSIIILFILALGVSIYFIYSFYTSPKYSIYELQKSILNKEFDKFEKYADLDSIIDDFLEQWIQYYKNNSNKNNFIEKIQDSLKIKFLQTSKDKFKWFLKKIFLLYFNQNHKDKEEKDENYLNFLNIWNFTKEDFLILLIQYKIHSMEYLDKENCIVNLEIQKGKDTSLILKLKFQKFNSRWKLVAITNLVEVLNQYFKL